MSTVIDLGSRLRSPALIKFFAADRPSICAAAMTRAQLGDGLWPEIMGDLSPIGRGVLRNRTDMGPLARRALASFGPHDLVLTSSAAPEKAEAAAVRSEEHTSELQSLMRISYAVFCLKKKKPNNS